MPDGRWLRVGWTGLLLASVVAGQAPTPSPAGGEGLPRLTFSKIFRGSQPEFVRVSLQADGAAAAEVRESAAEPLLRFSFEANPALTGQMFSLLHALQELAKPRLESKAKVGYLGEKTLAYDDATHHAQQVYNFTQVRPAAQLTEIFERIAATAHHAARLEHVLRYDRLGLSAELSRLQQDWDGRQLAAPQILFPVLGQIAADPALFNVARHRATLLLQRMQAAR